MSDIQLPSSFNEQGQWAWDNTSLNLFTTCPRKYYYTMILNWRSPQKKVDLFFGGIYASALELYHKLRAEGKDFSESLRLVVRHVLSETWMPVYKTPEDAKLKQNAVEGRGTPWQSSEVKNRYTLLRSVIWYLDEFREDNMQTHILSNGKPAVELSFKLPLTDDLMWCGHLDRVVEFGGDLYIQDQKTTKSSLGEYYFNQFKTDGQMSGYSFAGKAIFKLDIKGVVIDAAQIAVGSTQFARRFAHRTDAMLDEWYSQAKFWISFAQSPFRLGNWWLAEAWPMNRASCGNYGGCEYRDVCGRCPSVRDNFLAGAFEQTGTRWNPLKER